jgi:energy-dependent translational throttle protein EttA
MAGEYVYTLEALGKRNGNRTVLEGVTLAFFFGAKIGVIGGNGAGKSTLLRIMAGLDTEYLGTVYRAPRAVVGYLPQEPRLDPTRTVGEIVAEGVAHKQAIVDRYDTVCELLGATQEASEIEKLNSELGRLQDSIDAQDLWELDRQVEMAMDAMRLPPAATSIGILSGGEQRRVAICRLLLQEPDVLLLDEPTNHLDADSVAWLEEYLKRFAGTLVVVTHDRYFLSNVTEWILELDAGHAYPYKGNYTAWLEQKQAAMAQREKMTESRRKLLSQELAWVRLNASARQSRNKARLRRYEELANQDFDTREDNLTIQIPSGRRLGSKVIEARELTKAYGDTILMDRAGFSLPPGGIVGVIGGNGAGKTTLFRMIMGREQPTSGVLEIGASVDLSYVDQLRDSLDDTHTVYEEITGGQEVVEVGGRAMNGRAYCARFNLKGADQQRLVGTLSGGERNRVHLAKLLKRGGNVLLLDEPTNDLDVATLRSLEEGLANFGGCAVVISHDRWFLDRVATHILAFEGNSEITWFEGNYQAYTEWRKTTRGAAAAQPHRLRFRAFGK